MTLFELYTDYIRNKKDLSSYVEERKQYHTRGEFNDETILYAQECFNRLKQDNPEVYDLMYETLEQYCIRDEGLCMEYPITFTKEIMKIYNKNLDPIRVYENYKSGLDHHCQDS